MASPLPTDWAEQNLPIFKVFADQGKHPPVVLNRPVCVVGRDYDANLPLDAPQVSRHHVLIVRDRSGVYLRDLASKNGVQRNGKPVREVELEDEDNLRVGTYTLRCSSGFGAHLPGSFGAESSGSGSAAADDSLPQLTSSGTDLATSIDSMLARAVLSEASSAGASASSAASAGAAGAAGAVPAMANSGRSAAPKPSNPSAPPAELRNGEKVIPLPANQRTLLIGGREDCDLRLKHPSVSPVHAIIFELDGQRHVRDLNSIAGTFVNAERIHKTELRAGDSLRIGEVAIQYVEPAAAAAMSSSSSPSNPAEASGASQSSASGERIPLADDSIAPIHVEPSEESAAPAQAASAAAVDDLIDSLSGVAPDESSEQPRKTARPETPPAPEPLDAEDDTAELRESDDSAIPIGATDRLDGNALPTPHPAPPADSAASAVPSPNRIEIAAVIPSQPAAATPPARSREELNVHVLPGDSVAGAVLPAADSIAGVVLPAADAAADSALPTPDSHAVAMPAQANEPPSPSDSVPRAANRRPPHPDGPTENKTDPDNPETQKITTLVEEIAEKASELKEAWKEHRGDADAHEKAREHEEPPGV